MKNKKLIIIGGLIVIIILILLFCFCKKNKNLSIVAGGNALVNNIVMGDAYIVSENTYDFSSMLSYLKEYIKPYDLKFYSQESPIMGSKYKFAGAICYNTPYNFAVDMIHAGFNMVNLATNHTLEGEITLNEESNEFYCKYHNDSVNNSLSFWDNYPNVYTAGSYKNSNARDNINVYEKNGIKYVLLSYTTSINNEEIYNENNYFVNLYDRAQVKKDIDKIKDKTDLIIVSMHFDDSDDFIPSNYQKEEAKYLASLGVNVVLGHGPTVIQPIEKINDTVVIYSLGNLLYSYSLSDSSDYNIGQLAQINVEKIGNKVRIASVKSELIYNYHDADYRNIKIIPFSKMNENYNEDYLDLYDKYAKVVKLYDKGIEVNAPSLEEVEELTDAFKNKSDRTFKFIKDDKSCENKSLFAAVKTILTGYNIDLKEVGNNNCNINVCKIFDNYFVNCEGVDKLNEDGIIKAIETHKQVILHTYESDNECYLEDKYITILDYDKDKGIYVYGASNKKECNGWQSIDLIKDINAGGYITS